MPSGCAQSPQKTIASSECDGTANSTSIGCSPLASALHLTSSTAWQRPLSGWLSRRASPSLKPQSIKVHLYGVRNLHIENGFPCPLQGALQLRRLLQGIKRVKGLSPDSRLPITPSLLWRFFPQFDLSHYDHSMLWAAIMLALFGFMRCSELLSLKSSDLVRRSQSYEVTIRKSKCDPFRQGCTLTIIASGAWPLCAVVALDRYLARTTVAPGHGLFRFANSTHVGIPDWRIQALGRWSSDCYLRYIRLRPTEADSVATRLAQAPL